MTLSAQLRELAGKALSMADCWSVDAARDEMFNLVADNLPTILSALELQERLGKVETVEAVARAIYLSYANHPDAVWEYVSPDLQENVWRKKAKAAIAALKGGAR